MTSKEFIIIVNEYMDNYDMYINKDILDIITYYITAINKRRYMIRIEERDSLYNTIYVNNINNVLRTINTIYKPYKIDPIDLLSSYSEEEDNSDTD